jgi:hypothetical protein
MSIPVELPSLVEAMAAYGDAVFLLTGSDGGRPHIAHVRLDVAGAGTLDHTAVLGAGRTSAANARARPEVALLFPPYEAGGYSLIVDAVATVDGGPDGEATVRVTATRAVLHRPAAAPDGSASGSDCRPLDL